MQCVFAPVTYIIYATSQSTQGQGILISKYLPILIAVMYNYAIINCMYAFAKVVRTGIKEHNLHA